MISFLRLRAFHGVGNAPEAQHDRVFGASSLASLTSAVLAIEGLKKTVRVLSAPSHRLNVNIAATGINYVADGSLSYAASALSSSLRPIVIATRARFKPADVIKFAEVTTH